VGQPEKLHRWPFALYDVGGIARAGHAYENLFAFG
jgi:hypothetical protein